MNTRWLKAALLMLALAAIAGCSLLRFGYGQLDHYAAWRADAYFDLDAEQRHDFAKRFARLHEWHRYNQLPDYAAFLRAAAEREQRGLTPDDVLWLIEGVKQRYRVAVAHAAPDMAALLMTVTPAQLEHLRHRWDQDNRRFARDYRLDGSATEQRQARVRRVLDRLNDWTGPLTSEQEQKIAALAGEATSFHRLRHEDRMRRQREFLDLMAQRGHRASFAERLGRWLLAWEEGRDPEFARQAREWERRQAELYAAAGRMLTPQQRAHVQRRIKNYMDDFTRLAQRPATQADAR